MALLRGRHRPNIICLRGQPLGHHCYIPVWMIVTESSLVTVTFASHMKSTIVITTATVVQVPVRVDVDITCTVVIFLAIISPQNFKFISLLLLTKGLYMLLCPDCALLRPKISPKNERMWKASCWHKGRHRHESKFYRCFYLSFSCCIILQKNGLLLIST